LRFQDVLRKRLSKFSLELEPKKTRLVEFGRFALQDAKKWGKKMETIYFLGFTHFCSRNSKGNFMVGRKTEKSRLRRSLENLRKRMRDIRHHNIKGQTKEINQMLRGHYAYYGLGGNFRSLWKVYRFSERYWHKMLCSRSQKSYITWEKFNLMKKYHLLQLPKLKLTFAGMQALAVL
jgi:RNA-directed DNA polymerase